MPLPFTVGLLCYVIVVSFGTLFVNHSPEMTTQTKMFILTLGSLCFGILSGIIYHQIFTHHKK